MNFNLRKNWIICDSEILIKEYQLIINTKTSIKKYTLNNKGHFEVSNFAPPFSGLI